MNSKTRDILNKYFSPVIKSRGKSYFQKGAVRKVRIESNFVTAMVKGSKNYYLFINFAENSTLGNISCSCPYFRTDNCKHIAALIYYLDDYGYFGDEKEAKIFQLPSSSESEKKRKDESLLLKEKVLKDKLSPFVKTDEDKSYRKSVRTEYELDYSIELGINSAELSVVRKRLLKNGSVGEIRKVHKINFDSFRSLDINEKLIADFVCGRYFKIYFGYIYGAIGDINLKNMFGEILGFLRGRQIYREVGYKKYLPAEILYEAAEAKLILREEDGMLVMELAVILDGDKIPDLENSNTVLDSPLWIYYGEKIFKVNNLNYKQWEFFRDRNYTLSISKTYLDVFERDFLPNIASKLPIISDKYKVETVSFAPVKKIFLEEGDNRLFLKIKFGYGNFDFKYDPDEKFTSALEDGKILMIQRDKEFEEQAAEEIKNLYVKIIEPGVFEPRKDPIGFLLSHYSYFEKNGFEIFGESGLKKFKVNASKPVVSFNVSSGIDWFDVTTEIKYNDAVVPFSELAAAIKGKKKYVKLSDGSAGILPDKWVKKFKQTLSFGEESEDGVRFSKLQALALESILEDADDFQTDEDFREQAEKLKSFDKIKRQSIPRSFKGRPRDYQKSGVDWLYFLQEYSFGGILADDMGLGKTIQSIILLLKEKQKKKNYVNLIVAPTSVVFNWIDEIKKFAPSLKTLNHTGMQRMKEDISVFEDYDVVLTSYGVLLRDIRFIKNFRFHYVILDESQKIKNPASKTGRAARKLSADYRLCLTGTPIENNLSELWSQMAFLNPGLLGSYKHFDESFIKVIAKYDDADAIKLLKKTIYPFILRRTKEVVAKDLPEKTETIHYCEMEPAQEKVYNFWKESIRVEILREIERKGLKKAGFKVLEGLLRLRQICNHPALVKGNSKSSSAKFEEFKNMLAKVVAEGHKVLVFSQFVKMLGIMRNFLDENKIKYEYLTGSTVKRAEHIKNFKNNGEIKVFLISLKAGGFGLNLTEADYVFHYDPWWNPAVETQATDRTHRIGQDKSVFVYKFITKNSIEEKILMLQEKKKNLVKEIISAEAGLLKNLTKKDIEILFE